MDKVNELINYCKINHLTVCSCESLTAGLFCDTLAAVPGVSAVLKGGLVTYFTQMKEVLAHVPASLIEKYGVISSECALAMAQNTRAIMDADYCVSFTGNAGPDVMENKPAGTVYCAIAGKDKYYTFYFLLENQSRNEVRNNVVELMINELLNAVKKG